jgi:hypothetical protein
MAGSTAPAAGDFHDGGYPQCQHPGVLGADARAVCPQAVYAGGDPCDRAADPPGTGRGISGRVRGRLCTPSRVGTGSEHRGPDRLPAHIPNTPPTVLPNPPLTFPTSRARSCELWILRMVLRRPQPVHISCRRIPKARNILHVLTPDRFAIFRKTSSFPNSIRKSAIPSESFRRHRCLSHGSNQRKIRLPSPAEHPVVIFPHLSLMARNGSNERSSLLSCLGLC